MRTYTCFECGKTYAHTQSLFHHKRICHGTGVIRNQCVYCPKSYVRKGDLLAHARRHHSSTQNPTTGPHNTPSTSQAQSQVLGKGRFQCGGHGVTEHQCPYCSASYVCEDKLGSHIQTEHPEATSPTATPTTNGSTSPTTLPVSESALDGAVTIYRHQVPSGVTDLESTLRGLGELKDTLIRRVREIGLKWYPIATVRFVKASDSEISTEAHFRSKCLTTVNEFTADEQLDDAIIQILHNCEQFCREGSDWVIDQIIFIDLNVVEFIPLKGSSYIELPKELSKKKAIVNVQNLDNMCFAYAISAAIGNIKDHPERPSHYNLGDLDLAGLEFPLKLSQIPKFEKQNNISVNVFGYDARNPEKPQKKEIFPLYISKLRVDRQADLLLISEGGRQHYCTVRSLSRLLGDAAEHHGKSFYCRYCLHRFCREDLLEDHTPLCSEHGAQKIRMPSEEEKWLRYSNISHQLRVPYTIYCDFESFISKIDHCSPNPVKSSTTATSLHVPCGFAYIIIGPERVSKPVVYRGPDVIDTFLRHMLKLEEDLGIELDKNVPIMMTESDHESFKQAVDCHICEKPLENDRVRDHCHMTGKFRGPAHSKCNLDYQAAKHISVITHGLRNYDSHLIMQGLGKVTDREIKCIPNHMEKYISFSVGRLRFIDSFQFMNASLEKLTCNLAKDGDSKFSITKKCVSQDKLPFLLRKGVYPYSYVDGEARFTETALPPKEAFKNDLTGEDISNADYEHAQKVWDAFELKNLGEYHDLYLKTDILLLADIFENFRAICLKYYGLDPCHFYTAPGLAWESSLKMTGVGLELLTDLDMYLFVESGIRGGVSMISKRYAAANNKYMDSYDSSKPDSHIIYLDINNLYGWAMSLPLPIDSFSWLSRDEISKLKVENIPESGEEGYIFNVDLEYPESLHDSHNCYPLAPEAMEITEAMLSPHTQQLRGNSNFTKVKKLVPNLNNKTNYTVHYRNLQQYLSLGLKLTKIHKVLKFRQTPWLKPYIDFNTSCRKNANNDFEKDFFKLMNNAVFGKAMENLRKRVDVQLVQHKKKLHKLAAQPAFHAFKIFDENLVAVERNKVSLFLNRPIYAGFAILDLSKTCMYDFHYNYIRERFGDKAELLFTDTDSLCYRIETEDIYLDFQKDSYKFDFSNYPANHFLYSTVNNKIIGIMKDEMGGIVIIEFVGLRPKMYSIKSTEDEKKTAKGVTRSVVAHKIRHEDYKNCLLKHETLTMDMTRIVSSRHQIYTSKIRKLALSAADDKRYILEDGIHTLAHGHHKITELMDES